MFAPIRIAASWRRASGRLSRFVAVGMLAAAAQAAFAAGPAKDKPNPRVAMVIEDRGTITVELYPKDAPKTVSHFLDLVNKKFYDGIKFHRYVEGFVVQGGDPESRNVDPSEFDAKQVGTHGSGKTVPLEVKRLHDRGTVGLARAGDPNSGDSQFFFNLKDNHQLDSLGYCVFGKVVSGLDVMDKLRVGDKIKSVRVVEASKQKKKS